MRAESPPVGAAEQRLLDVARRAARQVRPSLALALHLSAMPAPAPRPHHRRIARAMLHEAALRHGGQMLTLAGGDLVLLCPEPAGGDGSVLGLPALLARLLRVDAPDPAPLVSLWPLPAMAAPLLAYATARAVEPPPPAPAAETTRSQPDRAAQTVVVDALAAAVAAADITDLLRRQTAVVLPLSGAGGGPGALRPLFREISFSVTALEARIGGGSAHADPYLFRHLASRLDRRMLDLLAEAHGGGGPLDAASSVAPPPHLNLTLPAIASAAFARFAASCGRTPDAVSLDGHPARGGIEVSLIEACADPAGFAEARVRVQAAGLLLVLDRVSHLTLMLTQLGPLRPDLLKLEWAPSLATLDRTGAERLDDALARLGPSRLVLLRADTEAAVRWGLARGIRRFQGRHVDAMLAASRLADCPHAGGCTLRQCAERGEAAGEAGRRFCRNTRLLDAAVPHPGVADAAPRVREAA